MLRTLAQFIHAHSRSFTKTLLRRDAGLPRAFRYIFDHTTSWTALGVTLLSGRSLGDDRVALFSAFRLGPVYLLALLGFATPFGVSLRSGRSRCSSATTALSFANNSPHPGLTTPPRARPTTLRCCRVARSTALGSLGGRRYASDRSLNTVCTLGLYAARSLRTTATATTSSTTAT